MYLPSLKGWGNRFNYSKEPIFSETDPTITTILAGLSFPTRRMLSVEESLEKNKERLQNLVKKEHTQNYESGIRWASNLKLIKQETKAGIYHFQVN